MNRELRELERLRRVEAVARKIHARWREQVERATAWQRLAAWDQAAVTSEDRSVVEAERKRLRGPAPRDWGDLRAELGEALGE